MDLAMRIMYLVYTDFTAIIMESLTEPPNLSHPLQPHGIPPGKRAFTCRLDATANDEVSPGAGGAMSAGEKSIKRAFRSC